MFQSRRIGATTTLPMTSRSELSRTPTDTNGQKRPQNTVSVVPGMAPGSVAVAHRIEMKRIVPPPVDGAAQRCVCRLRSEGPYTAEHVIPEAFGLCGADDRADAGGRASTIARADREGNGVPVQWEVARRPYTEPLIAQQVSVTRALQTAAIHTS